MNSKQKPMEPRKKDLITLGICVVASFVVFMLGSIAISATDTYTFILSTAPRQNPYLALFGSDIFRNIYDTPIFWVFFVAFLLCLYISFLESRDNDAFVTGKTQTLGVMNSFVGITAIIIIASYNLLNWVITTLVVCGLTFFVRELGRRFSGQKSQKYIGQSGILLTDLHNHGPAQI